jgi:hypothetical protein
MLSSLKKAAVAVAGVAALGLGGAAVADATGNSASPTGTATPQMRPERPGGGRGPGGGNHAPETPLTGDTKSKVEAAVLAKYPGATIERTETNTDGSAPYESHIKTSDGKELEVRVGSGFQVVAAITRPAHP